MQLNNARVRLTLYNGQSFQNKAARNLRKKEEESDITSGVPFGTAQQQFYAQLIV